MERLRIGIITSLTGVRSQVGSGHRDSLQFVHNRRHSEFDKLGYELELLIKDDRSDKDSGVELARECLQAGCCAIFGPPDTESMYKILNSTDVCNIPIICTLATASILSHVGSNGLLRVTTPDHVRADMLVRHVRNLYPGKFVYVYTLADSRFSYSQQIKNDVALALEKYVMQWKSEDFDESYSLKSFPDHSSPVIICAPSRYVANLASVLRKNKIRSQVFTFGSNTNLLTASLNNCITVCDLDREDGNPVARDEMEHFSRIYREPTEPSLSTMNGYHLLLNVIKHNIDRLRPLSNITQMRLELLNHMKAKAHEGLLGPISFTQNGEMAGNEHISVLRVVSERGKMFFSKLKRTERPLVYQKTWTTKQILLLLSIVGSVASIVSLIWMWVAPK